MEIQGRNVTFGETAADFSAEKTIEGEIIVPDYMCDAVRIIRTECCPRTVSKRRSDDRLALECVADVRVWFLGEDGKTAMLTKSESYTEEFQVKNCAEAVCIRTAFKAEYVNGSMVNSRKLAYKAVVSAAARCYFKRNCRLLLTEQTGGMECEEKIISVANLAASAEKSISVSDIIEISSGKGEIKDVIKAEATVFTCELKSVNNKIITRGRADTKVLYLTPEGRVECVIAELPFTQIIDIDGMNAECTADLRYTVNTVTASPRSDERGAMRQLAIEMDISVLARGYRNDCYPTACDAYSTSCKCELEADSVSAERFIGRESAVVAEKGCIDTSDSVSSVSDVGATVSITGVSRDGECVNVCCAVTCSLLAVNTAGEPFTVTRRFECAAAFSVDNCEESVRLEPEAKLSALSYSISGDSRVDIRYEVTVETLVFCGFTAEVLSSAIIDESVRLERRNSAPLVIYYAKKGDRIFEIAKAYRTTSRAIIEANSLPEPVLGEDKTIIIPIMKA